MKEFFRRIAQKASLAVGSAASFYAALLLLAGWALCGPFFDYSDTWQLVVNTTTSVVTFLMVFLIQNSQNRDAKAIHLKLNELLRAIQEARSGMVNLEELPDEKLDALHQQFKDIGQTELAKEEFVAESSALPSPAAS
ncbi:MAG TPA: low affinity iron permease family protein [Pirellulales bacterium]|nr:low affinity iron permease family protein [Pirellulales bacterium]